MCCACALFIIECCRVQPFRVQGKQHLDNLSRRILERQRIGQLWPFDLSKVIGRVSHYPLHRDLPSFLLDAKSNSVIKNAMHLIQKERLKMSQQTLTEYAGSVPFYEVQLLGLDSIFFQIFQKCLPSVFGWGKVTFYHSFSNWSNGSQALDLCIASGRL